jgi:ABC-type Fe3+/spermidine/putrescine transport system ATPase subunit
LLLLDEPYSNLDIIHKNILKSVLQNISKRLKITCVLVSHDPLDTLSWADHVLVLKEGAIIQQGTPFNIYKEPINNYVAGLFGKYVVLSKSLIRALNVKGNIVRPEDFKIVSKASKFSRKGKITNIQFFGSYYEIEVSMLKETIMVRSSFSSFEIGNSVFVMYSRTK